MIYQANSEINIQGNDFVIVRQSLVLSLAGNLYTNHGIMDKRYIQSDIQCKLTLGEYEKRIRHNSNTRPSLDIL